MVKALDSQSRGRGFDLLVGHGRYNGSAIRYADNTDNTDVSRRTKIE